MAAGIFFYQDIFYPRLNFSSVSCMPYISVFSALLFYFPLPQGHQKTSSWMFLHPPQHPASVFTDTYSLRMSHDSLWLAIYTAPQLLFLPKLGVIRRILLACRCLLSLALFQQFGDHLQDACQAIQTPFLVLADASFKYVIKCCLMFPCLLAVDGWIFFPVA